MTAASRLSELLHGFDRDAWRWECQGDYASDHQALDRWRAGLPPDETRKQAWLDHIRSITGAGVTFRRVRMLTDPLTDYLRWMIGRTQANVDAGEDIRWIHQADATRLRLPDYDFYLFDNTRLAIMRFSADKVLTEIEVVDEPAAVAAHRAYRDAVWPLAQPHADYLTEVTERGP